MVDREMPQQADDLLSEFIQFTRSLGVSAGDHVLTKALTTARRIVTKSVVTKTPGPHDFSSTQLNLQGDLKERVLDLIDSIPDEYLGADGKETTPHITVKYGLHTDDSTEVRRLVRGFGSVSARLGNLGCFCTDDNSSQRGGSNSDVIYIEVEPNTLDDLNSIISSLPHTDSFSTYTPHITLAYVQAGMGERIVSELYVNNYDLNGEEVTFDELEFSPASGEDKVQIPLEGMSGVVTKELDKNGGEVPNVTRIALSRADFITLPPNVRGTNCGNCTYGHSSMCRHPQLRGQRVTDRNCCALWDAPNSLRAWRSGAYNGGADSRRGAETTKGTRGGSCILPNSGEGLAGVESNPRPGIYIIKEVVQGTCKPGQRADLTHCTPASRRQGVRPSTRTPKGTEEGTGGSTKQEKQRWDNSPRSTVQLMVNKQEIPELTRSRKGVSVLSIASYLNDRSKKEGGVLAGTGPKELEELSNALASETEWALAQDNSAIGWYDAILKKAMKIAEEKYPELKTDPDKQSTFKVFLAVTSNQQSVDKNAQRARELYEKWRNTGEIETDSDFGGTAAPSINKSLKIYSKLLEKLGPEKTRAFLIGHFTVGELTKAGFYIGGELKSTVVRGANIFGPKLGSFYSNLYGDYSTVTMDRWFMRTFNRMRGNLVGFSPDLMKNQAGRLSAAISTATSMVPGFDKAKLLEEAAKLAETGNPEDVPNLIEFAKKQFSAYVKTGYKDKTEINKATKMVVENLQGLADSPASGNERAWIRKVVGAAQDKLKKKGINIENADLQALLWYYEKNLWTKLGYEYHSAAPNDYAKAFAKVFA